MQGVSNLTFVFNEEVDKMFTLNISCTHILAMTQLVGIQIACPSQETACIIDKDLI